MQGARPVDDAPFDPSAVAGDTASAARRRSRAAPPTDKPTEDEGDRWAADDDVADADGEVPPEGLTPEDWDRIRECANLDPNDRDNARRLIIWFGPDLAFVPNMGWLTWRGTNWALDTADLGARLLAQELVDRIKLEAFAIVPTGPQGKLIAAAEAAMAKPSADVTAADKALIERAAKVADAVGRKKSARRKFAVSTGNASRTSAMLQQATSLRAIDPETLDRDRMLFNVSNGTLRFWRDLDPERPDGSDRKTGFVELLDHDRDDMITKLAAVEYDEDEQCPTWLAFLDRVQPDRRMRTFLQVAHGYALLLGGNTEQVLIFHQGGGANGKSVFLETIGRLADSYRAVVAPETIAGDGQRDAAKANSDLARLHSTRFVTIEELPRDVPLKEALIKALTGGTKILARFLMKEFFEFDPQFTAVMTGNDMPTVSGTDYGIWRRLLLVPWLVTIPKEEQDPALLDKLDAERSGILNWLVDGALMYLEDGLAPHTPTEVTDFTQDYREERDPVGNFIAACLRPSPGETVPAGAMYRHYTMWCENNGIKPWNVTSFGRRLAKDFKKDRKRTVVYLDVEVDIGVVGDTGKASSRPPDRQEGDPGWSEPAI